MSEILDYVRHFDRYSYQSQKGLVLSNIVAILLIALLAGLNIPYPWAVALFVIVVNTSYWLWSQKAPKFASNKICFLISIAAEEPIQREFRADFINQLKQSIDDGQCQDIFDVKIAPPSLTKSLSSHKTAGDYQKKKGIHFILYGSVIKRKLHGEESLIIDINATVQHAPVEAPVKNLLNQYIRGAWQPKHTLTRPSDNYQLYEVTCDQTTISALYIIALGAFCSGDPYAAERLIMDVKHRIDGLANKNQYTHKISKEITDVKARIQLMKGQRLYLRWVESRDPALIHELRAEINRVEGKKYKKHRDILTLQAISFVILDKNYQAAHRIMYPLKSLAAVWYCNMAFLAGGLRDHGSVLKYYKQAASYKDELNLIKISEFEDFMLWFIEQNPDEYFVYFLLGQLNQFLKGDLVSAKTDYIKFLEMADPSKDPILIRRSNHLLEKI